MRINEFYPQLQMQTDMAKYKEALKSSQNILRQSQMQNRVYIALLSPI